MYYQFNDGKLSSSDELIDERGLAYADGFFSTIGVYDGQILWVDFHSKRLLDGVTAFAYQLDVLAVMTQLKQLAKQMGEGMIKIVITRQAQAVRGYGFVDGQAKVLIKTMPSTIYQNVAWQDGIAIQPPSQMLLLQNVVSHRVPRLAGLKLIACPEQVLCHAELLARCGDTPCDGLIGNLDGEWICATMGNIFYRLQGKWHTPPVNRSGVAGVMRAVLMMRFAIGERVLTNDDLPQIEALFTTNAVRGITPIDTLSLATTTKKLPILLPFDKIK